MERKTSGKLMATRDRACDDGVRWMQREVEKIGGGIEVLNTDTKKMQQRKKAMAKEGAVGEIEEQWTKK